jgi:hypothetical protein
MALRKHRIGGALAAITLLGTVATATLTGTASAAPLVTVQTTTLSVSPSTNVVVSTGTPSSFSTGPTTLKATVTAKPIGGLLITPSGKVTFTATDTHGDTIALGTANVGVCLLTVIQCTASLTTSGFYVASADQTYGGTTWKVTASYAGQSLLSGAEEVVLATPSSNTTQVTAIGGNSAGDCSEAVGCFAFAQNSDGSAEIQLDIQCTSSCDEDSVMHQANAQANLANAADSTTPYTAYAGFGAPEMANCPGGNNPVDTSGVSTNGYVTWPSAADVSASNLAYITYQFYGATAVAQEASADPGSICYAQLTPFTGATGPAVYDAALNQYEGVVGQCGAPGITYPCEQSVTYYPASGEYPAEFSVQINADTDPAGGKH